MEQLRYGSLKTIGYNGYILEQGAEKVLQFGEGNFLRAFVDYWLDIANEKTKWNGKCLLVQPTAGGISKRINQQDGLYTVCLRGLENGERVDSTRMVSVISRCLDPYCEEGFRHLMEAAVSDSLEFVVSNTTEAGIVYDPSCSLNDTPCLSFPGKLAQVLYARFRAGKRGLVILPCELIDSNGDELKRCIERYAVQWKLEEEFLQYLSEECTFCNTLVDRIVPGRIRDAEELRRMEEKLGYHDDLMDVGEVFGVWVIEGPEWLEDRLPFKKAGINCVVVPDVKPYKKRKVRILNGAHTGFVPGAYLAGYSIVRDCMHDSTISGFMNKMLFDEILPVLRLPGDDGTNFAAAVQDRFGNPFIDHELLSISLNSTSKWRTRNLPSLLEYVQQYGRLPRCLTMSFAAYIAFYTCGMQELADSGLTCCRADGEIYTVRDERWILEFYRAHSGESVEKLVRTVMKNKEMWGQDLTAVPGFEDAAVADLKMIHEKGAAAAFAACL